MTAPRFIDIHLLQPIPYANLNRDDLGSPKTLIYGGVERTRVSSQSWKRVVRQATETAIGDPAVRTRRLAIEVTTRLAERGVQAATATEAGRQILAAAGKSAEKGLKTEDDGATSALLFLPTGAIDQLVDLAFDYRDAITAQAGVKKPQSVLPADRVVAILGQRSAAISLFGRMLAELPETEVDGAVQVAHAFTVHATTVEVDFFTAVDDLKPPAARGSGHMNSAQFAAGVFYRYACLGIPELTSNLGGDASLAQAITREFLHAFATTIPTGKRTSTAPNTLPELAYLAVRSDRPVSLAGAFETPVRMAGDGGYGAPARAVLTDYASNLNRLWGDDGIVCHAHAGIEAKPLQGLGQRHHSYPDLISAMINVAFGVDAS